MGIACQLCHAFLHSFKRGEFNYEKIIFMDVRYVPFVGVRTGE